MDNVNLPIASPSRVRTRTPASHAAEVERVVAKAVSHSPPDSSWNRSTRNWKVADSATKEGVSA